jgi:hypothetical protein
MMLYLVLKWWLGAGLVALVVVCGIIKWDRWRNGPN